MTSAASRKARSTTFSAPRRLTPSEIESLRAHKKELHRKIDEIRARQAAERKAMTERGEAENQGTENQAPVAKAAAE